MSRWTGIDAFIGVVESGGFSAAAKALGVSKAHVSKQVRQLEERLGTRLLHRTTRRQALTEAGEIFYRRCAQLAGELDELAAELGEAQETASGLLRVSVGGAFAERYLAPACAEFMLQHPGIQIELIFDNRIVDLIQENFDLAIRHGPLNKSGLVARQIAPRELHICASPAYLERHGAPARPEDLRHHNCLTGSSDHWLLRGANGVRRIRINGNWHSNNGMALLAAARAGLGLVQLPDFYVEDDLQAGRLQAVLPEQALDDVGVWAVYPHRRHLPAKVRLLVEHLSTAFQPQPPWCGLPLA
jgi:DNA-binding transcriptional LysR family regulator